MAGLLRMFALPCASYAESPGSPSPHSADAGARHLADSTVFSWIDGTMLNQQDLNWNQ